MDTVEEVHSRATQYFWEVLITSLEVKQANLSTLIDNVILDEENMMLCMAPSEEGKRSDFFHS